MKTNKHGMTAIWFILAALSLVAVEVGADELHGRCVEVVDGDTLIVEVDGVQRTVHLFGIDAPEIEQPSGDEATAVLSPLVGSELDIHVSSIVDREIVGTVVADGRDVAATLIDEGCAWVVEEGPTHERYVVSLFSARRSGKCVWDDSDPVHPAKWRREHIKPPKKKSDGLSEIAAAVDLEKGEDGKVVIDSTVIPSRFARYAEGQLFVDRMIEIAHVADWVEKADRIWTIYCGKSGSTSGEGSVWSDELGAWVDGSIAPKGCDELDMQISAARRWIPEARQIATEDAARGGINAKDVDAVVEALDLEER